jgi:nucleoside-diphosphate-sugar epimerase
VKIAVTGARGYIGSALVRQASEAGYSVLATGRGAPKSPLRGVSWLSVSDGVPDSSALEGYDAVIHLAGQIPSPRPKDASDKVFDEINCRCALRTAASAQSAGIKHFVFVSTLGVHGTWSAETINENSVIMPSSPYAESKWSAEQLLREQINGTSMGLTIVRPPMVYGPLCGGNFHRLIKLVGRGLPLPFGSVGAKRSLIYVENLASLLLCCTEGGNRVRTFVVDDASNWELPSLLGEIASVLGVPFRPFPFPVELLQVAGRLLGRTRELDSLTRPMLVDGSKARYELGWTPPFDRNSALVTTVRSFVSHDE